MNVARALTSAQPLFNITEFIVERNLTNVMNVARALTGAQALFDITELILERNLNKL